MHDRPAASLARSLRRLPALLGVALLFGALYAVQKEFHQLKLDDIGRAIRAIPERALALAFGCTVLSYGVLTLYDRLGTIYAGNKVAYRRVAFASFCAYALSHNLGFAAVSGAAVRYRLYAHWGLSPGQIARTVAFCSLTFGLGGMVLGGAILFVEPGAVPWLGEHVPHAVLYAIGAILWGVVTGYVATAWLLPIIRLRGRAIVLPTWRMALLQVGLATADVAITATIFWVLLPATARLTWLLFLCVYVASYTAGLAANLPGGIGVFDSAILFGLSPFLQLPRIAAAIVVFRLFYYIIPLFLAGALFAGNEAFLRGSALLHHPAPAQAGGAPAPGLPRWSEPDFAVAAASGAVALSGLLLLGLGVLVPRQTSHWSEPGLAELALQAGQFVPSLLGAGLVVMAVGLVRRVNLAWTGALVLLAAGAAFVAGQGERYWPVGVLVLAGLVLAPFRALFYRHARLLTGPLEAPSALSLLALIVCVLGLAGFRRRVQGMPNNAWWEIVLSAHVPWGLRASMALLVALAVVALWLLLRPGRVGWRPWDVEARLRLLMIGVRAPEHADGLVLGEAERAAIPFLRLGPVLLGLGDPVGARRDRVSAIWRLCDLARQEGRDPGFWRVGTRYLKVYNDLGLTALPLGPEGLPSSGSRVPGTAPEFLVCVAERDWGRCCPCCSGWRSARTSRQRRRRPARKQHGRPKGLHSFPALVECGAAIGHDTTAGTGARRPRFQDSRSRH